MHRYTLFYARRRFLLLQNVNFFLIPLHLYKYELGVLVFKCDFSPGRNWRSSHNAFGSATAANQPQCRAKPWTRCSGRQTEAWEATWIWAASFMKKQTETLLCFFLLCSFFKMCMKKCKWVLEHSFRRAPAPPSGCLGNFKQLPVLLPCVQLSSVCLPQFGDENVYNADKEEEIHLQGNRCDLDVKCPSVFIGVCLLLLNL